MELPHKTHSFLLRLLCLFLSAGCLSVSAAPMISELLADNEGGLRDSDGEYEDWLEIFNPDADTIDLGGYYLTDNPENLTKWQIPENTELASNDYLVIFASGKDRAVAGQQLHTNFKLDNTGEYLALIGPDGTTVASEYAPTFPLQFDDASYGIEQIPQFAPDVLFDVDAPCKLHLPQDATLASGWISRTFNHSDWEDSTLSVGYDRGDDYTGLITTNLEERLYNKDGSVYLRIPFTLDRIDDILALTLDVQYDDGFRAYLNGIKVTADNVPVNPTWNTTASDKRTVEEATDVRSINLNTYVQRLRLGANVLAVQILNASPDDDTILFRPQLIASRLASVTPGEHAYFDTPTPGKRNGAEEELPASRVIFSAESQTFTPPFSLELTSEFPDEVIRYTTDGRTPTRSSRVYSGPISMTTSTQIKARAFGPNNSQGPVNSEAYIRLDRNLENFSSNLPILITDTWRKGAPGGNTQMEAFWAIIEPDPITGRASMRDKFQLATRAGLKRRGSSSFGWPKYSMSVEAQNEEGLDKGVKPLGMARESDWILSGRYQFDLALMRNDLMYRLSNDIGEYAVRTKFVEHFHNTGGGNLSYSDYFGVYSLMEKIKRDDSRVPVARLDRRDVREPDISGGYMFKKDRLDPGDSGFSGSRMGTFGWVEPKEREVTSTQRTWLQNHLREIDTALYRSDGTHPTTRKHFTEYIDQDSWLKHHWLNTFAMNVDGFRLSGYYYKHRSDTNGGKLGAGPIWDFDRTMQSTDGRDDNPSTWDGGGDSSRTWDDSRYPWWGRALQHRDFRQAHIDMWHDLRKKQFSQAYVDGVIDEFAAEIDFRDPANINRGLGRTPAERNFAKWSPRPRGGTYQSEIRILKDWLRTRLSWIDRQFTPQPIFRIQPSVVAPGTTIGFTASNVYYTKDGTDPRLPGGGVSSSASRLRTFQVEETTIITARARNGSSITSWSGPVTGYFLVGPVATKSNFVITEVHYAPRSASTPEEEAVSADPSDFEYIEMKNISPTDTIDLTGVHFANGVVFTFTGSNITKLAPGERVLVVCNQEAFEARYGEDHSDRIAGEFEVPSRLDNSGERIRIADPFDNTIADFRYNDKEPWPRDSGSMGYSMVLNSHAVPEPDYNDPTSWRTSTALDGTPNDSDSETLVGPPLADEDKDGLEALLEHALGTSDSNAANGSPIVASLAEHKNEGVTDTYLTLTFRRSLAADDVVLVPELSYDFINWWRGDNMFELESEENQGDGTSILVYRTVKPFDAEKNPQAFVRLRATMP